ncbi:MAG TPA: hypothetical protein VHB73_00290, partial [Alphaproteobacteria bacterium]|nr:hypothetical protein [Alphaproteobacteria bacterium]
AFQTIEQFIQSRFAAQHAGASNRGWLEESRNLLINRRAFIYPAQDNLVLVLLRYGRDQSLETLLSNRSGLAETDIGIKGLTLAEFENLNVLYRLMFGFADRSKPLGDMDAESNARANRFFLEEGGNPLVVEATTAALLTRIFTTGAMPAQILGHSATLEFMRFTFGRGLMFQHGLDASMGEVVAPDGTVLLKHAAAQILCKGLPPALDEYIGAASTELKNFEHLVGVVHRTLFTVQQERPSDKQKIAEMKSSGIFGDIALGAVLVAAISGLRVLTGEEKFKTLAPQRSLENYRRMVQVMRHGLN